MKNLQLAEKIWSELLLLCASTPLKDHDKVKLLTVVSKVNLTKAVIAVMEKIEEKEEK